MNVYLDNAATTPIDQAVFDAMTPYMLEHYGNPSSIHSHGRQVRTALERSRKKVAELLSVSPAEVFFTSGGTEADNTALRCTVSEKNIQHIITSRIEHHAVLHTVEQLEKRGVRVTYLDLDDDGQVNYNQIETLLKDNPNTLVSLMHGNNEIGNLLDLQRVGDLCQEYDAHFHSDTVQTMAHYVHDLSTLKIDFAVGSAHKFHGPKGIGFLYINHNTKIHPFIHGGAQERNMRGGTENVYGIVGLAKAMEIAYRDMDAHHRHIQGLKNRMIERLRATIPGVEFNGDIREGHSLYTVLNVSFPPHEDNDMLLFNLDINGISASGGSACNSGASTGSHVLTGIKADSERQGIRFSFGKYNTEEEVDYVIEKLEEIVQPAVV